MEKDIGWRYPVCEFHEGDLVSSDAEGKNLGKVTCRMHKEAASHINWGCLDDSVYLWEECANTRFYFQGRSNPV